MSDKSKFVIDEIYTILTSDKENQYWPEYWTSADRDRMIQELLEFYRREEEYEKCAKLAEIKNRLQIDAKVQTIQSGSAG